MDLATRTRSSTSLCNRNSRRAPCGRKAILGSLIVAVLGCGGISAPAPATEWRPWVTAGAGHESDLILAETPGRPVVAGGSFADLSGGASIRSELSADLLLDLGARGTLERFLNDDGRLLNSESAWADLRLSGPGALRLRLSAGGHFFDDSERPSSRRFGGGVQAGLGAGGSRWLIEAVGGLDGRRYPRLDAVDNAGIPGTYDETAFSAGASGLFRPAPGFILRLAWTTIDTGARDPWYDSSATNLGAGSWLRLRRGLWLAGSVDRQEREFDSRPAGADQDSYLRVGLGLDSDLGPEHSLSIRYAFARFEPTAGDHESSHRVSVALTWRPRIGDGPRPASFAAVGNRGPTADRPHRFRLRASGAKQVCVVGAFNGWDQDADPLRPVGDGWWEGERLLPVGVHAYCYLVDGRTVVPPEAEAYEDDGFGGRNGLIVVGPAVR